MPSEDDASSDDYGMNPDRPWERPRGGARRPGQVTAAAVVAVLIGIIDVGGAGLLVTRVMSGADHRFSAGFVYLEIASELLFGGLLIWGAVAAWTGRSYKILFFTALASMVIRLFAVLFLPHSPHSLVFQVTHIAVVQVLIMALLAARSSRDFFRG